MNIFKALLLLIVFSFTVNFIVVSRINATPPREKPFEKEENRGPKQVAAIGGGGASSDTLEARKRLAEDLLNSGYFVHLTRMNLFSEGTDLKLIGGALIPVTVNIQGILNLCNLLMPDKGEFAQLGESLPDQETTYNPNPGAFRPCVYFSLHGALIESHSDFQVEERRYAVLIPAQALKPWIVNFSPNDTAVWKPTIDLRKIDGCVVFAPADDIPEGLDMGGIKLETYTGILPNAVNNWLQKNTGKYVKFFDAPEGQEAYYDQALVDGHDLMSPEVFSDFLRQHPLISFGTEKAPKRIGFGSWIGFFNVFVEEFERLYKFGAYKDCEVGPLAFAKKYRVEPWVVLAQEGLKSFEETLIKLEEPSILEDFQKIQKPKIVRAIANLGNYANYQKKESKFSRAYLQRPYASYFVTRLVDYPYSFVQKVLANSALTEIKEETDALYWMMRFTTRFHGVLPVDEMDELKELERAASVLRQKVNEKRANFFYIQFLNSLRILLMTGPRSVEFQQHFLTGLNILAPALPDSGKCFLRHKGGEGSLDLKRTLLEYGLKVPQSTWEKGLQIDYKLTTPHHIIDAF